ncbi:MAG: sulfurtransferase [Betaproteobacteria bacterium]
MSYSTLVSCAVLAEHLNDPAWRVFDCRHQLANVQYGESAYAEGHLPGAFFMHMDRDLSGPLTGSNGRHPLPDPQVFAAKLGAAGVSRQTQVVVYDDVGGMIAGRLWWMLRWLGHENVALLDGGLPQWVKEGRALTSEVPKFSPAVFAAEVHSDWTVTSADLLTNIQSNQFCVIDARAPDRFRGENETIDPVGGHIPGARNRFCKDNLNADGLFRPAAELRREFLGLLAGVSPEMAVMQCGSGVTACHNQLAMEIAGLHGAKIYPGSWSEWSSDPSRPVAR